MVSCPVAFEVAAIGGPGAGFGSAGISTEFVASVQPQMMPGLTRQMLHSNALKLRVISGVSFEFTDDLAILHRRQPTKRVCIDVL